MRYHVVVATASMKRQITDEAYYVSFAQYSHINREKAMDDMIKNTALIYTAFASLETARTHQLSFSLGLSCNSLFVHVSMSSSSLDKA